MNDVLSNGSFTYRPGSLKDVAGMVLVLDQAIAKRNNQEIPAVLLSNHEVERLEKAIQKPTTWSQVVYDGNSLAGLIFGYPTIDPDTGEIAPKSEHVSLLMVHPDFWGKGIASNLLDWSFDETRHRGANEIELWTGTDNERSRSLYERKGFKLTDKTRICPDPLHPEPQVQYLKKL